MEQINVSPLSQNISEIIENTSSLRELTYAYIDLGDGRNFNETIFIDYLGLPEQLKNPKTLSFYLKDSQFLSRTLDRAKAKLQIDIDILSEFSLSSNEDEKNQLQTLITALEFTVESLEFECEAAGYVHNLSENEVQEKTERLYGLDAAIFGEHVSENPEFLKETYAYLKYLFDDYGDKLSSDEKNEIETGLDRISRQLIHLTGNQEITREINPYIPEKESPDFEGLKNIEISREDYTKIFDAFFSVSGVPQRSKEGNFGSFFDGDEFYGIPDNDGYNTKTLYELLKLAAHEAGHYINLKVTNERGDSKRPGDMEKEEGLAKITEKLISGIPLESMNSITFSAPSVALARLFNGDTFLKFQDAYGSLLTHAGVHSKKRDFIKEFLRKKRGFSKKLPGGSNKDASYSLGLFSVSQYIKSGEGSIANLFGGKISMDDVKSGEFLPGEFGNQHIFHIILAELIFFYVKNKEKIKVSNGDFHTEFIASLKEKYKGLSDSFKLFSEAERFTFSNKRKVIEILKIVDLSINKEPITQESLEI